MRRKLVLLSSLLLPLALHAADAPDQVPPEVRRRVEALVEVLASGDAARFERLAQEQFAPALLARRSAEERRQFLARFHGDIGNVVLTSLRATGPWTAEAVLRGGDLTATIPIELEAEPPHRIASFGVRVEQGGGDGEAASALPPPPSLREARTGEALAAALDPYLQRLAAGGAFSGVVLVARDGLIRNHYVGRTFIEPKQLEQRALPRAVAARGARTRRPPAGCG